MRRRRGPPPPRREPEDPVSPLDPTVRAAAQLAPPTVAPSISSSASSSSASEASARTAELQALACAMVEKAAFWGDGQRGVARLRFGRDARGGLAGATVVLEADGGAVSLRIEGCDEATADALAARLRKAGVAIEE